LNDCGALPPEVPSDASPGVRFVPQSRLPPGEPYERFIARTGTVPTRDNLHDFFNGLAWRRFPRTKWRLNEGQAAEIERHGVGATRGPLRDALTLLDENGAVLDAPPALWRSLLARDWRRLFVTERELWREARLLVFGHALLEKLVAPRKALTAHVLVTAMPSAHGSRPDLTGDDGALAEALDAALGLASRAPAAPAATKPFAPLPVLGIPLWWPGNSDFRFYDDPHVFRPARPPRSMTTTMQAAVAPSMPAAPSSERLKRDGGSPNGSQGGSGDEPPFLLTEKPT
jgi:hypothetical protein